MGRTKIAHNRGTQLVNVPIQFHIQTRRINWQIVRENSNTMFVGSCLSGVTLENIDPGDGWELVRRYLSVRTEDEQSILEFLVAYGEFEPPPGSTTRAHVKSIQAPERSARPEMFLESFSLGDFATIQDYVRRMLITGDPTLATPWQRRWFQRYEIAFAGARSGAQAHVLVDGVYPSILATVQFKLVQGATFRTCARTDCRLPFEITSRHTRRFCTQYCAHITSLRQRRKAQRKTKNQNRGERT